CCCFFFFFQAEDGIRDFHVTGVQTCALPIYRGYKTPYEIALMRQAQVHAVRGHRAAEAAFRAGASEFDIHMAYCRAVGQDANERSEERRVGKECGWRWSPAPEEEKEQRVNSG